MFNTTYLRLSFTSIFLFDLAAAAEAALCGYFSS